MRPALALMVWMWPAIALADIHVAWRYEDPAALYDTVIINVEYEGVLIEQVHVPATKMVFEYPTPRYGEYCFTLSAISVEGQTTEKGNLRGCAVWDGKAPLPPLLQFGVQ